MEVVTLYCDMAARGKALREADSILDGGKRRLRWNSRLGVVGASLGTQTPAGSRRYEMKRRYSNFSSGESLPYSLE